MADTIFGIPFDEELFIHTMNEAPDPERTAMIDSGAVVLDPLIESQIQNEGNIYTIPFYNILDGEEQNYDGQTDIEIEEVDGDWQTGVVYGRSKGFFARDFTAELSGQDPVGYIARSVAKYRQKRRQKRLIGILGGIFGITGASGNQKKWHDEHYVDLCSSTATPYTIGATDLNDLATESLGDNKSAFSLAVMHSHVAKTLENLELLEFWKQTDANGLQRPLAIGSVNGYTVIIDDGVPSIAVGGSGANKDLTKYTTYLLGSGCIRNASGKVIKPVEPNRDAKVNGGQDELITRMRETLHPNGFSYKIPTTGWKKSPTDEQLFAAANWELKFDPKTIPIAAIQTNG